jgi:hypothetical protein
MATTKGKRGTKKSTTMKKGKALLPVKPLKESIKLPYNTVIVTYSNQ